MASEQRGFATGHYGYGLIERALGNALNVGESVQRGALRSRLKRFAQLGVPESLEGQEGRRLYSQEECHQMLVTLLLGNLGLDPLVTARAVKKVWKQNLRRGAMEAAQEGDARARGIKIEHPDNPMVLHANLRVVTGPWRTKDPNAALTITHLERRSKRGADFGFEGLGTAEWIAALNYSEAAVDLHRALNRGE
jgi:hypothetical protein